ncbi:MAG: hypothetical protein M1816_003813 [Peltula sp. TS41687]|nr:MAG: hypothetical protein M1816_003813 [Peltula sp. TS41687]
MANMLDQQNLVDGHGYISNESSFYGDGEEKANLEARSEFHFERWGIHLQNQMQAYATAADASNALAAAATISHNNPHEGNSSGRQLSESVADFLQRLPLSTSHRGEHGPWLYIANPTFNRQGMANDSVWDSFATQGRELLAKWLIKKDAIKEGLKGRPASVIKSAVTRERKLWEEELRRLAIGWGCTTGKWLLFRRGRALDEAWAAIAEATAQGRLGIGAKVATWDGSEGEDHDQVICVYTANFADEADVGRVVKRLSEMGLAGKTKQVRYKTDAWTIMGIYREQEFELFNEYEFQTTLYSSQYFLDQSGDKKRKRVGDD